MTPHDDDVVVAADPSGSAPEGSPGRGGPAAEEPAPVVRAAGARAGAPPVLDVVRHDHPARTGSGPDERNDA